MPGTVISSRETPARPTGAARTAIRLGALICLIVVLPLVIVLGVVRFAFSWQPVYSYAVVAYHPEDLTGFSEGQLLEATRQIRTYFINGDRDLSVQVRDAGVEQPVFSDREIAHMRDVKALVRRAYAVLDGAALVALCAAGILLLQRSLRSLAAGVLTGSLITTTILIGLGLVSLFGFEQLFTEFHVISFSNDFWELDPATDHLVQIFPLGYWFDVTIFVAVLALGIALLLASLSGAFLLLSRSEP